MTKFATGILFFSLSLILQYIWIKIQQKIHLTQQQKAYGVNIDVEIKSKTPSMGGVIFLVLGIFALIINFSEETLIFWSLPILSGFVGFIDDWLKFTSHSSEGLKSLSKLKMQLIICGLWVLIIFLTGNFGAWPIMIPVSFLMIAGTINAVNITDGLDGLSGGLSAIAFIAYALISFSVGFQDIGLFSLVLVGGLFGFLVYNTYPAKIFMGDTGSLALGAVMGAIAILTHRELTLLVVAFIFVIETLSVILQTFWVIVFKRKLFLMTPLHHHFEKLGWHENDIVKLFWVAGLVLAMAGIIFGVWV